MDKAILIMDMPESCSKCKFACLETDIIMPFCKLTQTIITTSLQHDRLYNCPFIEAPEELLLEFEEK